jgi:uncharacterized protein (TIGR03032 family)
VAISSEGQTPSPSVRSPSEEPAAGSAAGYREVRYEHSDNLPAILDHLGLSLLVSTYQAGKLFVVGARGGALALSFHNFEQVMGIAVRPDRIAVGTRNQIWYLRSAPDIAPRLQPAGRYDGCFLARNSHFTGDIHSHELAWGTPSSLPSPTLRGRGVEGEGDLWVVNTLFSCLCTLHEDYSFVPRWRPPFISGLAAEDRCHLNGLALASDAHGAMTPRYVTAMAETDTAGGWRPTKATSGCLLEVPSGAVVARGFAMPHSPRIHQGRLWLLDSGTGRLVLVDSASGGVQPIAELPGYTRGLAFHEGLAFVGLSKIRETAVFGGVPIAEQRASLQCGVAVVELRTGRQLAHLEFLSGVEEIFAVEVLPAIRFPAVSGPYPEVDGVPTIWSAPDPGRVQ